ncbi:hypothetical protein ABPG72_009785 [Tetrahymena utriculariae]
MLQNNQHICVCDFVFNSALQNSFNSQEQENIKNLKSASFKYQKEHLDKKDIDIISQALLNFQSLEYLSFLLEYSEIQQKADLKYIFRSICSIKSIKHLRLYFINVDFDDMMCTDLAQCLANMIQLEDIDLSLHRNKISEKGINSLIQSINQLDQLQSLQINLNYNKLKDEGCIALAKGLKQMKNLQHLRVQLWANQIGNTGCYEIGNSLSELLNLQVLSISLSQNWVGDQGLIMISQGISKLQRLCCLDLDFSYNKIQDSGVVRLSHSLENLRDILLLKINFKYNHCSLKSEQQLFLSLMKPSSLLQYQIYIDDEGIQELRIALDKKIQVNQYILSRQILVFEAYFKHVAPFLPEILVSPISNHWDFYF